MLKPAYQVQKDTIDSVAKYQEWSTNQKIRQTVKQPKTILRG